MRGIGNQTRPNLVAHVVAIVVAGAAFSTAFAGPNIPELAAQSASSKTSETSPRSDSADDEDVPSKIWTEPDRSRERDPDEPIRTSTISRLVKKISPAVVNIIVAYEGSELQSALAKEKPFPGPDGGLGQGSGVLIHPDGYILTNHHVIENAHEIEVRLEGGSDHDAEVVGVDPKTDIALLRIRTDRSLPVLPLGDSDDIEVGDRVLAVGNPLGLEHTVTSGIISALGRHDLGIKSGDLYTDFIQIDVSINPGNSGGPLVGLSGDVIGINTAIDRKGRGIGFSIPINMVKTLLPQLKTEGHVTRSWLGAHVQAVTPALAESFGLEKTRGALITELIEGSPAARGGLQPGDVIVEFDGRRVRSSNQLPWMVATAGPNRTVEIALFRDGQRQSERIELAEHPEQSPPEIPETRTPQKSGETSTAQFEIKDLSESLARQLGADSSSGVVVTEVEEAAPAKRAGLRRRDVITEVEGESIESKTEFEAAFQALKTGNVVRLKLIRGGRVVFIAFER